RGRGRGSAGQGERQSGNDGYGAVRRGSAAGRPHTRGIAPGAAPAARASLSRVTRSTDAITTRAQPLLTWEVESMAKVLIIHGAGMNMRGKVQIETFGTMTLPEYDEHIP